MARYHDAKKEMKRYGSMINDDMSAPCNLPREVMDKEWPRPMGYALDGSRMSDLFSGVNKQMSADSSDLRREKGNSKY